MRFSCVVIIFTIIHSIVCIEIKEQQNSKLIDAIDVIIRKVRKFNHHSVNLITAVNESKDVELSSFKTGILMKNSNMGVKIWNYLKIKDESPLRKKFTIILLDNIGNFRKLNYQITRKIFQYRGIFIFVLVNGIIDETDEIFSTFWLKSISNVYALYLNDDKVNLSTIKPFESEHKCGDIKPKIVSQFIDGKFTEEISFIGNKFTQMNKCPVRVTTFDDEIYTKIVDYPNGTLEISGAYIDLLNVIAEQLNFSINLKVPRGPSPWGYILKNGTITGALKELEDETTDIAMGFYYLRMNRIKNFDKSSILFDSPLVLVVPPGRRYTSLEKLLQPFHWTVWLLLLAVFLVGILVILVINLKYQQLKSTVYGENVSTPGLNMIIALLGLSQTILPTKNFSRSSLMMFLLFCLVMRNTYQGLLYNFLQSTGRHKEIQSFVEMIEKNFTFYTYESEWDFVENVSLFKNRLRFFDNGTSFLYHRTLKENERVGVIDGLLDVLIISEKNKKKYRHVMYKQRLLTISIVFYMRDNFFLSTSINNKIDVIISSGLIEYWIKKSINYDAIHSQHEHAKEPKVMNINELKGPFIILIVGYFVTLIVFFFELLIYKIKSMKIIL